MWVKFGDNIDKCYIECKPSDSLSFIDYRILKNIFNVNLNVNNEGWPNNINIKEIGRILEIKRPFKLSYLEHGVVIKTVDSNHYEYFISKKNVNIFKFIIFERKIKILVIFMKYIYDYYKFMEKFENPYYFEMKMKIWRTSSK
jgi:hypothetical protein